MTVKVLAIASGGGHWRQLMMLRPAFDSHHVLYATTIAGLPEQFGATPAVIVPDANGRAPIAGLLSVLFLTRLILFHRPGVVLSTGALPGVIALVLGKALGAHTIWIDSIANAEEMSKSGKLARTFADHWLTQWPDIALATDARYEGSIL